MRSVLRAHECSQAGDASGTGLLNLESRDFDVDLLRKIDPNWRSLFPDIITPLATVGTLKRDIADRLGLPAGVIVAPGSGDNMMSALGSGCVSAGDLVVSLGTSGTVFGTSDVAVSDSTGTIAPFCDATGARQHKCACMQHVPAFSGYVRCGQRSGRPSTSAMHMCRLHPGLAASQTATCNQNMTTRHGFAITRMSPPVLRAGRWLPLVCAQNCTTSAAEVQNAIGHSRDEMTRLAEFRRHPRVRVWPSRASVLQR